eukprot:g1874.t1
MPAASAKVRMPEKSARRTSTVMVMEEARDVAAQLVATEGQVYKIKKEESRLLASLQHKERQLKKLLDIQEKKMKVANNMKRQNDWQEEEMAMRRERGRNQKESVWGSGERATEARNTRNREIAQQVRQKKKAHKEKTLQLFDVHQHVRDCTKQERELRRQRKDESAKRRSDARAARKKDNKERKLAWQKSLTALHSDYAKEMEEKKVLMEEAKKNRCLPSNTLRADRYEALKNSKLERMREDQRDRAKWMKRTLIASYSESITQTRAEQTAAEKKMKEAMDKSLALDRKIREAKKKLEKAKVTCKQTSHHRFELCHFQPPPEKPADESEAF